MLTAGLFPNHIRIVSATTGVSSDVDIILGVHAQSALGQSSEFDGLRAKVNGGADLFDVSELTVRSSTNNWQEQFLISRFGPSFPTSAGFRVRSFTLATLPTDFGIGGELIFVSDATGDSLTGSLCFSNGTVWVDVTTGAAVA